ncbi:hypothetical protein MBLNU457_5430t1 [Dothideomycetes sp. NU457]
MSDDEADPELLELLRRSLGISSTQSGLSSETRVLHDAEHVYNNSIDVSISRNGTVAAAALIWDQMQQRSYDTNAWSKHELHPKAKDEATVNFIFTMDLLNFSFWSELPDDERFSVTYRGIPITTSTFWLQEDSNDSELEDRTLYTELFMHVFRSDTAEDIPLSAERLTCLREAAEVLEQDFQSSVVELIQSAEGSAGRLVNLLAHHFDAFRDESRFDDKKVRILKRAQIFVTDLWAAFGGEGYGRFDDIDTITMFADYRVPQMLHALGCLSYSPPLDYAIRNHKMISSGHSWEVQLRGNSIWCVELIRRQILKEHPEASVNAILIDFFLYDLAKEREAAGEETIPHHRTRSIWY